jgi:tyrosyl-tRNA synthetase
MSKSLGNAVGIHEPPLEMYGKIMSISDDMMWRYYELLTDVQMPEIEKIKREVHPMQAKKDLARRIVADFHSTEAAAKAAEDWAKQFQKGEVPDDGEEIEVPLAEIVYQMEAGTIVGGKDYPVKIRLNTLLVKSGLAESGSEASRKIKEGAVRVNGVVAEGMQMLFADLPPKLTIRVGKRVKIAVIHR